MEKTIELLVTKFEAVIKRASSRPDTDAPESVEAVTALLGAMGRDEYLAFRSLWKERYMALTREIRLTKPLRKGDNEVAATACHRMRLSARRHMVVRRALRELARAHHAARLPA